MGTLEIVLLIAGVIIFTLSFLIPARREEFSQESRELAEDEIKKLVSGEMDSVKGRVDDVVGEAVDHAVEKTERSLERLSNEKIMAVSDYSDTVIKDIHKNHEEVVFLYDMLNDKHTSLKNTVAQVNETVKTVEETTRGAEAAADSLKQMQEAVAKKAEEAVKIPVDTGIMRIARLQGKIPPAAAEAVSVPEELAVPVPVLQTKLEEQEIEIVAQTVPVQIMPMQTAPVQSAPMQSAPVQSVPVQSALMQNASMQNASIQAASIQAASMPSESIQFVPVQAAPELVEENQLNSNEKILSLYKQGKSEVVIAKELGLGVGEVSLVINLYKG